MPIPAVTIPAAVLASEFPTNANRTAGVFNTKASDWANSENAMATRTREIAEAARLNALTANQAAAEANASAGDAATQVTLATNQATIAVGAVATSGATLWVTGTTYAIGNLRYSPLDLANYRRRTAGAGAVDPSLDPTNWAPTVATMTATTGGTVPTPPNNTTTFLRGDATFAELPAPPASALVLLATLTPTAAANVDFLSTFSSTYDSYLIIAQGLLPASDSALSLRFANAGAVDTGSNYLQPSFGVGVGTAVQYGITFSEALAGSFGLGFHLNINNCNSAPQLKSGNSFVQVTTAATPTVADQSKGIAYKGGAISGVRLYWAAGVNFVAQGSVRVYGYSKT